MKFILAMALVATFVACSSDKNESNSEANYPIKGVWNSLSQNNCVALPPDKSSSKGVLIESSNFSNTTYIYDNTTCEGLPIAFHDIDQNPISIIPLSKQVFFEASSNVSTYIMLTENQLILSNEDNINSGEFTRYQLNISRITRLSTQDYEALIADPVAFTTLRANPDILKAYRDDLAQVIDEKKKAQAATSSAIIEKNDAILIRDAALQELAQARDLEQQAINAAQVAEAQKEQAEQAAAAAEEKQREAEEALKVAESKEQEAIKAAQQASIDRDESLSEMAAIQNLAEEAEQAAAAAEARKQEAEAARERAIEAKNAAEKDATTASEKQAKAEMATAAAEAQQRIAEAATEAAIAELAQINADIAETSETQTPANPACNNTEQTTVSNTSELGLNDNWVLDEEKCEVLSDGIFKMKGLRIVGTNLMESLFIFSDPQCKCQLANANVNVIPIVIDHSNKSFKIQGRSVTFSIEESQLRLEGFLLDESGQTLKSHYKRLD